MRPADFLTTIYRPSAERLGRYWPNVTFCPRADQMLITIAGQESNWAYRHQIGGPARGLWQFERGGGVAGVLRHKASKEHAAALCYERGCKPDAQNVYDALAWDDTLALGFARLLLLTEPAPLPVTADAGWDQYMRTWRPGKPHRERWGGNWIDAAWALAQEKKAHE